MLVSRQRLRIEPGGRILTLAAGAADMGANFLFLLAAHAGMLSLAAVIASLFPAPTVILARVFLRQRVPPVRMAGLALALAGVALISLR
jgi:drug/metabolite transporter (DMT)-like permease